MVIFITYRGCRKSRSIVDKHVVDPVVLGGILDIDTTVTLERHRKRQQKNVHGCGKQDGLQWTFDRLIMVPEQNPTKIDRETAFQTCQFLYDFVRVKSNVSPRLPTLTYPREIFDRTIP